MDNILDKSVRDWLQMAVVGPRDARLVFRVNSEVHRMVKDVATKRGWTMGRVANLALLFGLAALVKYWEEDDGRVKDEL